MYFYVNVFVVIFQMFDSAANSEDSSSEDSKVHDIQQNLFKVGELDSDTDDFML